MRIGTIKNIDNAVERNSFFISKSNPFSSVEFLELMSSSATAIIYNNGKEEVVPLESIPKEYALAWTGYKEVWAHPDMRIKSSLNNRYYLKDVIRTHSTATGEAIFWGIDEEPESHGYRYAARFVSLSALTAAISEKRRVRARPVYIKNSEECTIGQFVFLVKDYGKAQVLMVEYRNIEKARAIKAITDNFSDMEEGENSPDINLFNPEAEGRGGDAGTLYRSRVSQERRSPSLSKAGGIDYSFGVEVETAGGEVPMDILSRLPVSIVGDGSVAGHEYVSKPLHGSLGIYHLKKIMKAINKYCLVDDSCSIHFHIGGFDKQSEPSFNRLFSYYALKLGSMIEDELFSLTPPGRKESRYCSSIKRYKDINLRNHKSMISSMLFDGGEYDSQLNSKYDYNGIRKWHIPARYHWLNLVNCNTSYRDYKTIEFRNWSGSTKFEKVYNYLLISLAITSMIENHRSFIEKAKKISLSDIINKTIRPRSRRKILEFIDKRKTKFNPQREIDFEKISDRERFNIISTITNSYENSPSIG